MKQLSGLDASFLSLETPSSPMHVTGVAILAGGAKGGRFDFAAARSFLASRLHLSPTFRQRLLEVPLNLGRPYWVPDEDFDLDAHLERTQLPEPGGWKELRALVSWELGQLLDRRRPLWKLLFVEGVDTVEGVPPGSVALICRIHHAAIDGLSGAEIMGALFDLTPGVPPAGVPPSEPWLVPPAETEDDEDVMPGRLGLTGRAVANLLRSRRDVAPLLRQAVGGIVQAGKVWGVERFEAPPVLFSAPRTRFNHSITHERVWDAAILDLDRVREVKNRFEATVNDVVLAICAGALRRYLVEKDELPERPLVAMVPVSVRSAGERGTAGNQVSAMLVSLATDVADPVERLLAIRRGATGSKIYHRAIGARTLVDSTQLIPFSLAGLGARLYSSMHLADRVKPAFNLVITNVPGPQVPLYVGGARCLAHLGAAPLIDGLGLILAIFSYNGKLAMSATACRALVGDIDRFTSCIRESFAELEEAAARG